MMLRHLKKLVILIFFAGAHSLAHADGDGRPSVEFLNYMSDAIVVGTGTITTTDGKSNRVEIVPMRIIKGSGLAVERPIVVTRNPSSSGCSFVGSSSAETAIWFLSALPNGSWRFADSPKSQSCHPLTSDFETSAAQLPSEWTYDPTLDSKDKLAYELAFSIESNRGDGPVALIMNPLLLKGLSKTSGAKIYTKLAASRNANVRMVGLLGQIDQGDISALRYLSANLTTLESAPARSTYVQKGTRLAIRYGSEDGKPATQAPAIAESISYIANPDNEVVTELQKILQNTSYQSIRYAAAKALQNLHTPLAVTFLGPLLNSDDPQIRAFAIGGLSCFANGVPTIDLSAKVGGMTFSNTSPFKTLETLTHFAMGKQTIEKQESYFLDYWRAWWSANGPSINANAQMERIQEL